MASAKKISLETAHSWTWRPPETSLPAAQYARAVMRGARRYASAPQMVETSACGSLTLGLTLGGYRTVALGATVSGGWGSYQRATAAEWAGGKRWIIRDASRGRMRDALDHLRLPESDGRYLLVGAPERPVKGVTAWRTRWTVARKDACGLVAVAGEGIEGASVKGRLVESLAQHRRELFYALADAGTLRVELAALLTREEEECSAGREALRRLRAIGREVSDAQLPADDAEALRRLTHTFDSSPLKRRAARTLERYAQQDSRPLAIGVRATRTDGTPNNHYPDGFTDAHEVGKPATAPDWDPSPTCGRGLHYVPAVSPSETRDAETCVANALRYAGSSGYALWIVRAEIPHPLGEGDAATAVMIDGHKAKARTLTPLARCGAWSRDGSPSAMGRALKRYREHLRAVMVTRGQLTSNEANAEHLARLIAREEATLKAWRRP